MNENVFVESINYINIANLDQIYFTFKNKLLFEFQYKIKLKIKK